MILLCTYPSDQPFPSKGEKQDWRCGLRRADSESRYRLWWDERYLVVLRSQQISLQMSKAVVFVWGGNTRQKCHRGAFCFTAHSQVNSRRPAGLKSWSVIMDR